MERNKSKHMKQLLLFALCALSLLGCKKDEEESTPSGGNNGGGGGTTGNTMSIQMDGQTYTWNFGTGANYQFSSQAFTIGSATVLTVGTSMYAATGNITYASVTLPIKSFDTSVWLANPTQGFINFFNDDFTAGVSPTDGSIFVTLPDGNWSSYNAAQPNMSGDWVTSSSVVTSSVPAQVRASGSVTLQLENSTTSETKEAVVTYNILFQQP
jgi:hypothetical protein